MVPPSHHRSRRRSGLRATLTLTAGALALTACFTGQRPSFEDEQPLNEPTGSAEIDEVLERLDSVGVEPFSADYEILTKLGSIESTATVVQADDGRRSITVNDIRFLINTGTDSTCDLVADTCEAVINDARISDTQLTHDFYAGSFAQRLRVDANRRVGDPRGYQITQAGQQATCVDVPVTGGSKSYCALDSGQLARYDGADQFIEMVAIGPDVDEAAFEPS
ncbi:MAG: hypothetical protein HRT86_16770 [Ilumatobacteraceae bacterium]|nr:hypothetical protein [Ilumatobacteraceae bacterium]